jgi:hypothetical protein
MEESSVQAGRGRGGRVWEQVWDMVGGVRVCECAVLVECDVSGRGMRSRRYYNTSGLRTFVGV